MIFRKSNSLYNVPTSSSSPAVEDSQSGGPPAEKDILPDSHTHSGALEKNRKSLLAYLGSKGHRAA